MGGLGGLDGPGTNYRWTRPNPLPALLPWLAILGLLLLPRNRCGQAWGIWLPLAVVAGLSALAATLFNTSPSTVGAISWEPASLLGFGLAGTWLLLPWAARGHRFVNALCFGAILAAWSTLHLLLSLLDTESIGIEILPVVVCVGFCAGALTLSLHLAGWFCRSRYSPARLSAWLGLLLVGCSLLGIAPFFVFALLASGGGAPVWQLFVAVLIIAGLDAAVVFPFLMLSFVNPFYRQRLEALLRVGAPPPLVPPPPPPVMAAPAATT